MLPGVYSASKKNGDNYYRASITYMRKHISLGSYAEEKDAYHAYLLSSEVLSDSSIWNIENYPSSCILSFHKWVVLNNVRDHKIYFKNPIYLNKRYFFYYLDKDTTLTFDVDDLFYYANHKILKRGGHMFASDYGMQINILSRYGIKNYSVCGKDFIFVNGDDTDYRYGNIEIINRFYGVSKEYWKKRPVFTAKVHINGDYLIGRYQTETEAAIAYNKATHILLDKGLKKNFPQNYIDCINEITYASTYQRIRISKKLIAYAETMC